MHFSDLLKRKSGETSGWRRQWNFAVNGYHINMFLSQTESDFSPTGLLSGGRGFEYRPQQQQMAVAVAAALENRDALLVEAGTGVGKSLAYLIPAVRYALE